MIDQPTRGDASLEVLLDHLKRDRGFDFTGYKRTSLERRIAKRMQAVGVDRYVDYVDYLEVHPDEFPALFDTILINVTGFFRDPPAWEYFAGEIVPRLLDGLDPDAPIRVWCAGCASGEETYTMAMVLAEALGEEDYLRRVKIYATEVDEEALSHARVGAYSARQVEAISPPLLERYFERGDQRYTFRKDLRPSLIFGRNDLTRDAPISRIDVLTCRNTLMYFNAETQARILHRFHFALNPWGYLFLGQSEMLIAHSDLFLPVNLKRRVFSKVVRPTLRDRLLTVAQADHATRDDTAGDVREGAFDAAPSAQVVVDANGTVVLVNAHARAFFGLSRNDIGRPLKDLELSYRPLDLRSNLERAYDDKRALSLGPVEWAPASGSPRELRVQVIPLADGPRLLGASIVYDDVTHHRRVENELQASKRELETAYEELQSAVEELETANEELQSTNEELETTNEELQSANEELETINEELRRRSLELGEVNAILESILRSMGVAVIVVDLEQTVKVWNDESAELWGIRSDEAEGERLFALDIGLPMDGLRPAVQEVLAGAQERADVVVEATNRRGRTVRVKVTCVPAGPSPEEVTGAIVLVASAESGGPS